MRAFLSVRFCLTLLGLILTGFGCRQPKPLIQQLKEQAAAERAQSLASREPPQDAAAEARKIHERSHRSKVPAPEIQGVIQALRNLHAAVSYRAASSLQTPSGTIKLDLEVNRRVQGVHATVHLADNGSDEIIYSYGQAFLKVGRGPWQNNLLRRDGNAQQPLLDSILSIEGGSTSTFVNPGAVLLEAKDDPRGCHLVRFENYRWGKEEVDVCVLNALPVSVAIQGPNGNQDISYRDFDQPIDIHAPASGK